MANDETRMTKEFRMTKSELVIRASSFIRYSGFVLVVIATGCASDKHSATRPASASDRQEAALKDPFGYSPNMDESDISGGGIGDLDRKGMRKDIDDVLNP
jgi:hypothetical protein